MKYRKRPVAVEAWRFFPEGMYAAPDWVSVEWLEGDVLYIPTLEGVMRVNPGDWLIRGVRGEVYPCREDIFAETYEFVEGNRNRLSHTMLRVGELEESINFYTVVFGMKFIRRVDRPEQKYSLAFVGYGDEDKNAVLELTYNYGMNRYDHGTAFGHIAIEVGDINAVCDAVRVWPYCKVVREPGPVKGGTTMIAFIEDPDGYRVELIER